MFASQEEAKIRGGTRRGGRRTFENETFEDINRLHWTKLRQVTRYIFSAIMNVHNALGGGQKSEVKHKN